MIPMCKTDGHRRISRAARGGDRNERRSRARIIANSPEAITFLCPIYFEYHPRPIHEGRSDTRRWVSGKQTNIPFTMFAEPTSS